MKPILAITAGEPAGIGLDVLVAVAQQAPTNATLVYVGDPHILSARARQLNQRLHLAPLASRSPDAPTQPDAERPSLYYSPVTCHTPARPGQLSVQHSAYVIQTLENAVSLCENGHAHAIVTGPVHKGIINEAGIAFTGHTEWLRQRTRAKSVVMLMANPSLRLALSTTHIALSQVSKHISTERLTETIHIVHAGLQSLFGISKPRIAVCGLNPHAGENGHMGREEIDIIEPVLAALRCQGMTLIGPLPADTAFIPQQRTRYDACITHYHDQGLPVLKALDFEQTINISLGLPIIRTSVDHGTALELAGTGQASVSSFRQAIHAATAFAQRQPLSMTWSETTPV
ncbi:MAG: 4-hydroxythreonine-4-phosphate dehydrogenase PdxA [Gammaproteobacteria bacterium]